MQTMTETNLLYLVYGMCIMFHLMMGWVFCCRKTGLVKKLIGLLMLLVAVQYAKDLVFMRAFYSADTLMEHIATSLDMVTVRPSEVFQRDGYDVWVTVPITFSQAVLGDTVQVPSIDGKVEYTVPEGTQSGTTFRLRGKGIQYLNGRGRGDMYVKCEVEIPKKLNKTQREALKKFEGTLKEENYEKRKGFFKKLKDMFNS